MIYKIGMLCKHFKGNNLLEKNIYRIIQIGVNGSDLTENVKYTGDGDFFSARNLVVYENIFQEDALFAREYEDISSELSNEKMIQYGQKLKVQPLTNEEIESISSKEFVNLKKKVVADKFKEMKKK